MNSNLGMNPSGSRGFPFGANVPGNPTGGSGGLETPGMMPPTPMKRAKRGKLHPHAGMDMSINPEPYRWVSDVSNKQAQIKQNYEQQLGSYLMQVRRSF